MLIPTTEESPVRTGLKGADRGQRLLFGAPERVEGACRAVTQRHGARLPERVAIILEGKPLPDKSAVDVSQRRTGREYM